MIKLIQKPLIHSIWNWDLIRGGKLIDQWREKNLCTDEGLNKLLNVMFKGATQITSWYVAIFESNTTPAAGDTYASPSYTESTAYSESTRPAWTGGTVASKSVDNSASRATFTMNADKTIYGAALVGGGSAASTKADTAGGGTLYCSSKFSASRALLNGDTLLVTVTLTSSDV